MRLTVWVAIFWFCMVGVAGAPAAVAASANSCQLKEYASLPVTYSSTGLPKVQVTMEGHQVSMFINTSSAFSVLDISAANALHLSVKPLPANFASITAGTHLIKDYVTLSSLKLGELNYQHAQLFVAAVARTVGSGDAVGWLGTSMLATQDVDLELDFGHEKINLFAARRCPSAPIYWADRYSAVPIHRGLLGEFYTVMELDGKRLEADLSTGVPQSVLDTSVAKRLYGFDSRSLGSSSYRAMTLSASGLRVLNANIRLIRPIGCDLKEDADQATAFNGCFGAYPLQLGMSVLKKLRLYLSERDGRVYFTAADAKMTNEGPAAATRH